MKYPRLEQEARNAVDNAKKKDLAVITNLQGYNTKHDLLILRDLLRYASEKQVQVIFMPMVK